MDRDKVIKGIQECDLNGGLIGNCPYKGILTLLKEQEAVVHPEPSCEMTYITDCCCDLCGVQLIREDKFCRCCGKRIEWESR